MTKKINYSKIAIVVFLTALIWVFADRAQDTEYSIGNITINISKSVSPELWVSFDDELSISINNVILGGPVSKIGKLEQKINDGSFSLKFFLNPEQIATPGKLDVKTFLAQNKQIKELGLTVISCQPETILVKTVTLVEKLLKIQCIDENQNPRDEAIIKPQTIEIFVPPDWQGDRLIAYVKLLSSETTQAVSSPVKKTPYINLTLSQTKDASMSVEITMSQESESLQKFIIKTPNLGFTLSSNLLGKYDIEVRNLKELMDPIVIRATRQARQAYENMDFHVILEIMDEDVDSEEGRRPLFYNFPENFVREKQIKLDRPPVQAIFKLKRISSEPSP